MGSKQSSGQGWSLITETQKQSKPSHKAQAENRWKISIENRPGGRIVTVVKNAAKGMGDHQKLLKTLQGLCGAGGTLREGGFELQGEHQDKVRGFFEALKSTTQIRA